MSISLIKKIDNSKENQKEIAKAILTKKKITVHLDYCLECENYKNVIRTGKSIMFIYYAVSETGVEFLKETLKKLLQFKNIMFSSFTRQELLDYLEISNQDILKDLKELYNLNY